LTVSRWNHEDLKKGIVGKSGERNLAMAERVPAHDGSLEAGGKNRELGGQRRKEERDFIVIK